MSFSNEQFVGLIKKNPISIGCGVLIVALLAAAYFRADLADLATTELEERTAEADRLAANLKNAAQLKEQLDTLLAAEKSIEGRMIRSGQLTTNQQYFYKLESEAGVKLLDLRQSALSAAAKSTAKGTYLPTAFTLNVQGDYQHLLAFLRQLESGTHYCRVLGVTCNSAAERGAVLVFNLNLELLGFP